LNMLDKQGAIISNKSGSVNLSEINDVIFSRYLTDGISKYDQVEHKIVECLLDDWTEIEFPDYTYFKGIYLFPVEYIEDFIFQNIIFTGNFKMDNLKIAGEYAFYYSNFSGSLNLPVCTQIGIRAFQNSNFSGSLSLPVCTQIGYDAFANSNFSGSLSLPVCVEVGDFAFRYSHFSGELSLPVCEYIGDSAFVSSNFSGELNLPVCTFIGKNAFLNSNFNSITIGANATLENNCIGAHSAEFIDDYTANNKKAGTYVWDGSHWIYQ